MDQIAPDAVKGTAPAKSWLDPNALERVMPRTLMARVSVTIVVPLILVQAAGWRRPIKAERAAGLAFGSGVGVLYAVTTISGPPLAIALNNQGVAKQDFRAALGFVRLAESSLTAVAYLHAGLFTAQSINLIPLILPSIFIGVPIGAWLIRHVRPESFWRVCMSFDAWVVAFGVSTLLQQLGLVAGPKAFLVLAAVMVLDGWMMYRFFSRLAPLDQ